MRDIELLARFLHAEDARHEALRRFWWSDLSGG
jgi:hypothetical protein